MRPVASPDPTLPPDVFPLQLPWVGVWPGIWDTVRF